MHVEKMRPGEPYAGIVSDEHASAIGAVLILWSQYQNSFTKLYRGLYAFIGTDETEWARLDYRQQTGKLLKTLDETFENMGFVEVIRDILNRSRLVEDKRHSLAHGNYSWTSRFQGAL